MRGTPASFGSVLAGYWNRLVGKVPPPPWFAIPPANHAQVEVLELLGEESYRRLATERKVTVSGSRGGRYVLWAARALRGAGSYLPKVFDEQRQVALCVALDPSRRSQRAWEDEWNGLIRWICYAEPIFLATANPLGPYGAHRIEHPLAIRSSAEAVAAWRALEG